MINLYHVFIRLHMRKMKIVMSADCLYPAQLGGPSNSIYWQAKALTRTGHDVTIVAISEALPPTIPLDQWLQLDCGRVIYTRNPHFYLPIKHIIYGWGAIRQADVVHVNSLFYPSSIAWVLMSRLARKPVIWSPHGELSPAALRFRNRLKKWRLRFFRRLGSSVCFHATCAGEVVDIRTHFGVDVQVIEVRNMLELPPVLPPASTPPYLLFIGRLHPIKAIDQLLIAASESTLFQESAYLLLIVGPEYDKAYSQRLKKQVLQLGLTNKVVFCGLVQGTAKDQLYANALATILPSHTENFGNVVIESLAQGTPVIASTGTPWQLLENERAGSWVSNDPASLRQAIENYLTMPVHEYSGYRTRAAKLARRNYDIMQNAGLWEQVYRTLLRQD